MSTPASTNPSRTPRIFISHSHLDERFALQLAGDFEGSGAYVWIDKHDIKQGDFLKRINEGLARCDWLVLVETSDSLTSDAVEMEVNAALNRVLYHQMRGVLRCIAGPRDAHVVPPLWATLQYYDATGDYAAAVAATLAAIRDGDTRWVARSPSSTSPIAPPAAASPTTSASPAALIARIVTAYTTNDWHAVADRTGLLLEDRPDAMTVEVWRMRGRALLELARSTEAVVALKSAYGLDTYDLPTVRAYARAERALGHEAQAEPLLRRAMALADDDETRLDILREYVPTLQSLDRWPDALSRTDEALKLRPDDSSWLRQRLASLMKLNRNADALSLAEQITARSDASSSDWLDLARLIRTVHPSPPGASDTDIRARISDALDAAARPATRSHLADPALTQAVAEARRTLLPEAIQQIWGTPAPMTSWDSPQPYAPQPSTGNGPSWNDPQPYAPQPSWYDPQSSSPQPYAPYNPWNTTLPTNPESPFGPVQGPPVGWFGTPRSVRSGVLIEKQGKAPGTVFELRNERTTIGRSRDSDIFLDDLAVSRFHATINRDAAGAYTFRDENTENGIFVNGDKVAERVLENGDELQIGQTMLVFQRR